MNKGIAQMQQSVKNKVRTFPGSSG
jgi:hypothetical protein